MSSLRPFDPLLALRVMLDEGVRFVVIGGFGSRLLGSSTVTNDLDLCYGPDRANIEALARALKRLHARLRGAPAGLPFQLDGKTLEMGDHFTFSTDAGSLDVMKTPAGVKGFDELDRAAQELDLDGLRVRVASLDDLIRMKQAAGRPKDLIEAEILGALREELEGG